eukprot:372686-Prymnesium_polylepis.1
MRPPDHCLFHGGVAPKRHGRSTRGLAVGRQTRPTLSLGGWAETERARHSSAGGRHNPQEGNEASGLLPVYTSLTRS